MSEVTRKDRKVFNVGFETETMKVLLRVRKLEGKHQYAVCMTCWNRLACSKLIIAPLTPELVSGKNKHNI